MDKKKKIFSLWKKLWTSSYCFEQTLSQLKAGNVKVATEESKNLLSNKEISPRAGSSQGNKPTGYKEITWQATQPHTKKPVCIMNTVLLLSMNVGERAGRPSKRACKTVQSRSTQQCSWKPLHLGDTAAQHWLDFNFAQISFNPRKKCTLCNVLYVS